MLPLLSVSVYFVSIYLNFISIANACSSGDQTRSSDPLPETIRQPAL
jgi:hypothetical protein